MIDTDKYDDKSLLMKAVKVLDNISAIVGDMTAEQNDDINEYRDELINYGLGMGFLDWWEIADTMEDHWVNRWWRKTRGER